MIWILTKCWQILLQSVTSVRSSSPPHMRRYIGDIRMPHLATPRRAKRALNLTKVIVKRQRRKILSLQQTTTRFKKRINNIKELVKHLKEKNLISEDAMDQFKSQLPNPMEEILKRVRSGQRKYSPQLRAFALTLNFYSPRTYNYVKKSFQIFLPYPSTIRKWYSVLDGRPGFTAESLEALKCQIKMNKTPVLCNLVIDEMAIRQEISYDGQRTYGIVDLGVDSDDIVDIDRSKKATNVLFFMLVAINNHWKLPVGYFLLNSLTEAERANLLRKCLELINETGANVQSLTFDGAVNINMCRCLGANFTIGDSFQPYFTHPVTNKKVYCFFDPCHMLKLVRNSLHKEQIMKIEGKNIYWADIVELQKLEQEEGLRAGTKLTKKHISFQNNRMNVKLAAQTLSESVSCALKYIDAANYKQFYSPEVTAEFCSIFNNAFDILNVRSQFSKGACYKLPLNENNFKKLQAQCEEIINYIKKLTNSQNQQMIHSIRKTGFQRML